MRVKRLCFFIFFICLTINSNASVFKKNKKDSVETRQAKGKEKNGKSEKIKEAEELRFALQAVDSLTTLIDSLRAVLDSEGEFSTDSIDDDFDSFEKYINATRENSIRFDSTTMAYDEFDYMLGQLLSGWAAQVQSDSGCVEAANSLPIPDSIYIWRLAKLPHVIEMPYNHLIRSGIDFYITRNRILVQRMLGMSNYYFPIFEQALVEYDLPLELRYLPVIESALNTKAISRAGAAGLWQFMIGTGRQYGLEVNSLIDERMDPLKSTKAAARFLKDLYSIYGDWNLAIAAYNCGPGNVNKAIRRSGGSRDFWQIYPYLPRETRGYLPIFVAANYIMNYYEDHRICPVDVDLFTLTDTIMISDRIHFEQIVNTMDVSMEQIRLLNPQYRRDIIPGDIKPYALCLPLPLIGVYLDKREEIVAHNADRLIHNRRKEIESYRKTPVDGHKLKKHKVVKGETLSSIGKKYRVSVANLQKWNNIKGSKIKPGQQLIVRR